MKNDQPEPKAPKASEPSAADARARLDKAVAEWDSAAVTTLGPMISTEAFNALTELRANLKAAIAAALS